MSDSLFLSLYYFCRFICPLFINECMFLPYIKKRKHFAILFPICVVFYFSLTFLVTYFDLDVVLDGWFRFNFLTIFILSVIPFIISTKANIKEMLFFAMASYAMQNFADKTSAFILVGVGVNQYGDGSLLPFLFINILFSILFLIVFVSRMEHHSLDAMNNKYIYLMMVLTLFIVYILSMYAPVSETLDRTFISVSIYSMVACVLLLIIQFNVFNLGFLEYEKKILNNLLNKENAYYKQVKANIDSINIKTHDLKHQIRDLRQNVKNENEITALNELEKEVGIYDNSIKTGNPTLDIIIQDKKFYCAKHGIELSPLVDGELLNFIEPLDLYSLFGNLIDNAIEAVLKLPREKRVIQLNVKNKQGFIVIQTLNNFDGKAIFENDLPKTTKIEGDHGFGSKSIVYIAKKYGGRVDFRRIDDLRFEVSIFFKNNNLTPHE